MRESVKKVLDFWKFEFQSGLSVLCLSLSIFLS